MTFKQELKIIRKEQGLNKKEMSRKLKIPYRTYQNWELGINQPPAWTQEVVKILAREN